MVFGKDKYNKHFRKVWLCRNPIATDIILNICKNWFILYRITPVRSSLYFTELSNSNCEIKQIHYMVLHFDYNLNLPLRWIIVTIFFGLYVGHYLPRFSFPWMFQNLKSCSKYFWKNQKIRQNLARAETFDVCLCVTFEWCFQKFLFWANIKH